MLALLPLFWIIGYVIYRGGPTLNVNFDDPMINKRRFAIKNGILLLMTTQQSYAHNLRLLAALLEVTTELVRSADHLTNIGERTIFTAAGELLELDNEDDKVEEYHKLSLSNKINAGN